MKIKKVIENVSILLFTTLMATPAFADMPWESSLTALQSSLEGPTAKAILIMAIIIAGLAFAVGEAGGFFRKCAAAVMGGAIAMGAANFASLLWK
jgi:type IV secretory pathway VirB2 component (pilin)